MATEDRNSEDSGTDIGASVDGILQILVRCLALGHAMFRVSCVLTWGRERGVESEASWPSPFGLCLIH